MPPRPTRTAEAGGTRSKLKPVVAPLRNNKNHGDSYEMIAEEIHVGKKVGTEHPSVRDESDQTFTHQFY